jgi:hypothetical protein
MEQSLTVRLTPQDFDALKAFLSRVPVGITEAHALAAISERLQAALVEFQAAHVGGEA